MSRSEYQEKTAAQILEMQPAGLATAAALAAVRAAINPGISTLELDAIAEAAIMELGGRSNFQLVAGYHHTICASINDEVVHGIPSKERILAAGDIISIDAGAEVNGWNSDAAFSLVLPGGDPIEQARREKLAAVTEGSLWAGIAALAKAAHLNEVGTAVEGFIEKQGDYGIIEQYVGHGVGRSMHEDPPVYNYRVRGNGPKVRPGLVVAIEPMVTAGSADTVVRPDGWTVATVDGSAAAHFEHTIAVHSGGVWVLTAPDGGKSGLSAFGITPVLPNI
ncbi:MAG: type I methionyl aminopeptidase [Actinomycetes bacterium]